MATYPCLEGLQGKSKGLKCSGMVVPELTRTSQSESFRLHPACRWYRKTHDDAVTDIDHIRSGVGGAGFGCARRCPRGFIWRRGIPPRCETDRRGIFSTEPQSAPARPSRSCLWWIQLELSGSECCAYLQRLVRAGISAEWYCHRAAHALLLERLILFANRKMISG